MAPSLTSDATADLKAYIDSAVSADTPALPGAILHIVDAKNNAVFTHGSGGTVPLNENTMTMVHSFTKIIGATAFMQLVDRGLASLDDASLIEKVLPELAAQKVLTGFSDGEDGKRIPVLVNREGDITPRMLMNHTYGGGHTFFNELLKEYLADGWDKTNEVADPYHTALKSPLLWQPGTHTNYGQGLDWLAVLIERITKQSLVEYLQANIFDPLSLEHIGYEEMYGGNITSNPKNAGLFWPRSFKQPDGTLPAMDPPVLATVERPPTWPEGKYHNHPLGTGIVTSAADYARILTAIMNDGVDPVSNHRLLSPESAREITSPQLPAHIQNDSRVVPSAVPGMLLPGDLEAPDMDPEGSFGLACGVQGADRVLRDGGKGRSKGTFYWYSAANAEFWADREKGIVVVAYGNFFPWNDGDWVEFVRGVEGRLYKGLRG